MLEGRWQAGHAVSLPLALSPDQASPSYTLSRALDLCWTQEPGQPLSLRTHRWLMGSESGNGIKFGSGCEFRPCQDSKGRSSFGVSLRL